MILRPRAAHGSWPLVLCALLACESEAPAGPELDGAPGDAGRRDTTACEEVEIAVDETVVNVLILLDRSGSMYEDDGFGNVTDRWTPAVAAIETVTEEFAEGVRFGLMRFGSGEMCDPGTVDVVPALGTAEPIAGALAGDPAEVTGGSTPTATALAVAGDALADLPGANYVLLITDGAPNCNPELDGR